MILISYYSAAASESVSLYFFFLVCNITHSFIRKTHSYMRSVVKRATIFYKLMLKKLKRKPQINPWVEIYSNNQDWKKRKDYDKKLHAAHILDEFVFNIQFKIRFLVAIWMKKLFTGVQLLSSPILSFKDIKRNLVAAVVQDKFVWDNQSSNFNISL